MESPDIVGHDSCGRLDKWIYGYDDAVMMTQSNDMPKNLTITKTLSLSDCFYNRGRIVA